MEPGSAGWPGFDIGPYHPLWGSIFPNPMIPSTIFPDRERRLLALFTDFVTNQIVSYGYVAIFILMLLESACIPIPSEVMMLFGGALASAGFVTRRCTPGAELCSGPRDGRDAGRQHGWIVARVRGRVPSAGRPLVDRFGRYLLLRPHEIERAHVWFERTR